MKDRPKFFGFRVLLLSMFALSCGSRAANDGTGRGSQSLNGSVVFDGGDPEASRAMCGAQFQATISLAFSNILVPLIRTNPGPMLDCLKEAQLSGEVNFHDDPVPTHRHADVRSPEEIMRMLAENVPTQVACQDELPGGATCGSGNGGEGVESFSCRADLTTNTDNTLPVIAGILIHEIAHKVFDHPEPAPDDYNRSVNQQARACVESLASGLPGRPYFTRRSEFASAEISLSQVGREFATPVLPTYCPANDFIKGFAGRSNGTTITFLGGVCAAAGDLLQSGSWSSGVSFRNECAGGQVAVGARGMANDAVNAIGTICASLSNVQNGALTSVSKPLNGGAAGSPWERRCPPFYALKGLRLRASASMASIPRIELVCQDVRDGRSINQSALASAGSAGSFRYFETCQTRGVAGGLIAVADNVVTRLGGMCMSMGDVSAASFSVINPEGLSIIPTHGGWLPDNYDVMPPIIHARDDRCPAGQALIGMTAHVSGGNLTGIQGRCAEVGTWSRSLASLQSDLPLRGQASSPVQRMCPAPKFVSGWFIDTDLVIHGITPVCRQFGTSEQVLDLDRFAGTLRALTGTLLN